MDTFLAIVSRREVRAYADRLVPEEVQRHILEAARISGSSANKQQWRFVVVESQEAKQRLAEAVYVPANLTTSAFSVAVVTYGKGPGGFDAGRAASNLMLAAWNEGVGSCPNGLSNRAAARAALGAGDDEDPVIVVSFGYQAKPVDPESRSPEEWIAAANRKPFDEVVTRI